MNTAAALIANAPFDNLLATGGTLKRDVKAAYAELQVPVIKGLDLNVAARTDEYTGFGRSTNPKITLRYAPSDKFLLRGSYSTGFRVPTFKQMFDPRTESTYVGNDIADPAGGTIIVDATHPAIHPLIYSGGKSDLQPEEAVMKSMGFVFAPNRHISFNVDYWDITRDGTIQLFGVTGATGILTNYALFPDRFIRDSAGTLIAIDTRWINAGETITKGIEYGIRGNFDLSKGHFYYGLDISHLLEKKSRLIATAPFGASEVGKFTRGDLGIEWKYTAFVNYKQGNWSALLTRIFRSSYLDGMLPGVANGSVVPPNWKPYVDEYVVYNFSLSYKGIKNMTVIAGIKNLLNTDPPFTAGFYDTNTGGGSDWEPRVADPRGRAFTLSVEYKFK
jgi:iron complex outermembrane receptor protein